MAELMPKPRRNRPQTIPVAPDPSDVSVKDILDEIDDDAWFNGESGRTLESSDVDRLDRLVGLWDSAPCIYDEKQSTYVVTTRDKSGFEVRVADADEIFQPIPQDLQDARDYNRFLEKLIAKQRLDIEDFQAKLAEAVRPTETETIAALKADMAEVLRKEIEDLRSQVLTQEGDITRLQREHARHLFACQMTQTIRNYTSQLAAEEAPRLSGLVGQVQRDLEQALDGGTKPVPPTPAAGPPRSRFSDLEID